MIVIETPIIKIRFRRGSGLLEKHAFAGLSTGLALSSHDLTCIRFDAIDGSTNRFQIECDGTGTPVDDQLGCGDGVHTVLR